ncbi:hypothetical protein DMC30DRAFT_392117 [Rhodotorula diobovata]|uniref:FAR1 domain-containing protein n=1 Tax=Rhodotorula diobovata TaxID=5288 RepID=A0A5C5G252_9BASI|nr:hypothetical protein DMC30DRAFT_392117 [Rhodotorula diobovata]
MIPVYGNGLDASKAHLIRCNQHGQGCPVQIHLGAGGRPWRVLASSVFEHNHGRDPRIVKNPAWRPVIKNAAARRAVERRDAQHGVRTTQIPRKREGNPEPDAPAAKKQALGQSSAPEPKDSLVVVPGPASPAPAGESAAARGGGGFADDSAEPESKADVLPPAAASPATTPGPSSAPTPARRVRLSSVLNAPPPDPSAFLADLTAFLTGLDPSLAPLAQVLVGCGMSSLRDLRAFVQFEPSTRMALYEDLLASASGGNDAAMLDVELVERLEELLTGAQAAKWR